MFDRLIASKTSGTVSVLVHAGVCAAAVLATLRPQQVPRAASLPIVLSWPLPSREWTHHGGSDQVPGPTAPPIDVPRQPPIERSEEHTSELQSLAYLVCRLLLEKKKKKNKT